MRSRTATSIFVLLNWKLIPIYYPLSILSHSYFPISCSRDQLVRLLPPTSSFHTPLAMAGSKTKCAFQVRKVIAIHSRYNSSQALRRQSSLAAEHASAGSTDKFSVSEDPVLSHPPPNMPKSAALSILPLSAIVRSLAITSISSSPVSTSQDHSEHDLTSIDPPRTLPRHHVNTGTLAMATSLPR